MKTIQSYENKYYKLLRKTENQKQQSQIDLIERIYGVIECTEEKFFSKITKSNWLECIKNIKLDVELNDHLTSTRHFIETIFEESNYNYYGDLLRQIIDEVCE